MNKKKIRRSLGGKLILSLLAACMILCAVALTASYSWYHRQMENNLMQQGSSLSSMLTSQLSAQALNNYAATGKTDARYDEIQTLLRDMVKQNDTLTRICVIRLENGRALFLFDSVAQENILGTHMASADRLYPYISELTDTMAITGADSQGSRYMTTVHPVALNDGSIAGYILVELCMDEALQEQWTVLLCMGLLLLGVILAVLVGYLFFIRNSVIMPIRRLTDAVQAYEGGENKASLRSLELKGSDELRRLADAFRMMLVEIDLRGFEERELAVREERVDAELKLTTAINAAITPKALPSTADRLDFDVRGMSDQTGELSCDFYDYFLLSDGRLGVVLGAVPSEGVSAALFMVVAKTAIKSQLRVGMSILEAMTEANRQLFEVGQGMVVNAIVGVLDENGVFSYINAGQQHPLLLRAQDRYEWQSTPVYAPLGQNENVTYQVQQLHLRQGDRLFFHTEGLDNIVGVDGQPFGAQRMQAALNASRSKYLDLDALLVYMRDEGKTFAARPNSVGGFTILALDYLRSRKDLAHCVVDRDRSGSMELTGFLKRQLSENGFAQRTVAHMAVLIEEVFALCCRQKTEGLVTVECAVNQNSGTVTVSLKSNFGGVNPLQLREGTDMQNAIDFINASAQRISFQPGQSQDVLTVVKEVGEAAASGMTQSNTESKQPLR